MRQAPAFKEVGIYYGKVKTFPQNSEGNMRGKCTEKSQGRLPAGGDAPSL